MQCKIIRSYEGRKEALIGYYVGRKLSVIPAYHMSVVDVAFMNFDFDAF